MRYFFSWVFLPLLVGQQLSLFAAPSEDAYDRSGESLEYSQVEKSDKTGARLRSKRLKKKKRDLQDSLTAKEVELIFSQMAEEAEERERLEAKLKKERQDSLDEELKRAIKLSKEGDVAGAITILEELICRDPKNADYYFYLGLQYRKLEWRYEAVDVFEEVLRMAPDYQDALVELGELYRVLKVYDRSYFLLHRAVELKPDHAFALTRAARLETDLGHYDEAEALLWRAWELEPDDRDIGNQLAYVLTSQARYSEGADIYRYLFCTGSCSEIDAPLRYNLYDTTSHTDLSVFARAGSAEEKEKDLTLNRWVATIKYLNAEAGFVVPVNDRLRFTPRARTGTMKQSNLVSKTVLFDTEFTAGALKGEWQFTPAWTLIADLAVEWVKNHDDKAILTTRQDTLVEPTLMFRYSPSPYGEDTLYFGETTDSIVFRNFAKSKLDVVTRQALVLGYKKDYGDHRRWGADAAWLFYQDPVHNQEQDLNWMAEMGLPYFEDLIQIGYNGIYRQFRVETNGYYSFQYQLTHWLRAHLLKKWDAGWRCELEYMHGWRTTRGRDPQQQIVVGPLPSIFPVVTVGNQIDLVLLTLGYNPGEELDWYVQGSYYHDKFDYTIYGAKVAVDWRF